MRFIGIDFANNKKEEYGPGVQGKEHSAPLDPSAVPMPAAEPSLPGAATGVTSTAGFPSASITSAGAATASSVHFPISAPLGAGSTSTSAAPEEMVSAVHAGACIGRRVPNLFVYWIFWTQNIVSHGEKSPYHI